MRHRPELWMSIVQCQMPSFTFLLFRESLLLFHDVVVELEVDEEHVLPVVEGLEDGVSRGEEILREQCLHSIKHNTSMAIAQLKTHGGIDNQLGYSLLLL